jgi:hypothetical protein
MRAFACPVCQNFASFEGDRCQSCGAPLGCNWLVPETQAAVALRRLVYQLHDLGLPIDPYWRRDGGLAFDLLSSYSTDERITIGHANGVITIDLVESLDA